VKKLFSFWLIASLFTCTYAMQSPGLDIVAQTLDSISLHFDMQPPTDIQFLDNLIDLLAKDLEYLNLILSPAATTELYGDYTPSWKRFDARAIFLRENVIRKIKDLKKLLGTRR